MRLLSSCVLSVLLFVFFVQTASASLVTIESDGEVVVSVLGVEDEAFLEIPENESVEVTNSLAYSSDSQISLTKDGESVVLSVGSGGNEKTLEVTDYEDEVIEIEERPQSEKLAISVNGDRFKIRQGGLIATTDYEITVDPKRARILLDAPSGKHFLSISPREAIQILLRAKTLNTFDSQTGVLLVENDDHDLTYQVKGDKTLNFFDFYYYPVEVTAHVSALTGEIVEVDAPQWLKIIGFLFA